MEQRLNRRQRLLVEANHAVIYKVLGRYGLPVSEYYGIAALALCEAALSWSSDGDASFETYVSVCIRHALANEVRRQTAQKRTALKRVPFSEAEKVGSREFDPDFYAELGLFDDLTQDIDKKTE